MHYLLKRLIQIPVLVIVVVILGFFLLKAAPGDPATMFAGEGATPEYLEMIRHEYGLDKPVLEQLITYLQGIIVGDWGYALSFESPVLEVILDRLPYTLLLSFSSFLLAVPIGVLLGMIGALRRNTAVDYVIAGFSAAFNSIPAFIIGLLIMFVFSVQLKWLPLGGVFTIGADFDTKIGVLFDVIKHLILPALSLSLIWMVGYTRVMRNTMIEALLSDYIRASTARGISRVRIVFKHAFRNSILSIVTLAGIHVGYMLGGVILTETVFSWYGIGSLVVESVAYRDYPLLMGLLFFSAIWVGLTNLFVDLFYTTIDPRVKLR